ncbi:Signal recognition particle receptor subunit alpha [Nosema granulosis]|uniref:Signal recognition particle receptor subunit alpha homolog n=1 Tax=Nosema granulosis TaxID=83296 RepID=A0A9P6H0N2_9MICR|nr:Signal recognition particle receptor subunit alpha [Nosema granulosis]
MSYFCMFNKKGWLLHEEGRAPNYLSSIIVSLDTNKLSGTKNVRDDKVEYEIRGPIVYLSVGHKESLNEMIRKFNEPKEPATKKEKVTKKIVDEETILNYSQIKQTNSQPFKTILNKSKSFVRNFNLFSSKIPVNSLRNKMEIHLVKKNVDYETTKVLTDCVMNELKDQNLEYVSPEVFKKLMGDVLRKLIPCVDHENLIKNIKEKPGAYSFCFIGVNGVGKSTSLAKMAYWLLQHNLKVYIAACDTFRAGAVEQLKVHVERFRESGHEIGFYEKGYGKDDASVARTAIHKANEEGYDVILIDTAGRMHNKATLMDSLSKLIRINEPDHILYVGEALVGTDSLSHILEFNKAVGKFTDRKIDSILLTKIDTVDDKIGQILNMTFSSHSPVMFLGTGQTNSDLMRIDSEDIINILMS